MVNKKIKTYGIFLLMLMPIGFILMNFFSGELLGGVGMIMTIGGGTSGLYLFFAPFD